jgi:hypothetical protein
MKIIRNNAGLGMFFEMERNKCLKISFFCINF